LVQNLSKCEVVNLKVEMDECFKIKRRNKNDRSRKIGENEVVLKAVEELRNYCKNSYFIALIPEENENIESFIETFKTKIPKCGTQILKYWNTKNWGFISWKNVHELCERYKLYNPLEVFNWNTGQIY